MAKILCLDQATLKTGYSLFDDNKLITFGILEVDPAEKNIIERMKLMSDKITNLIESLSPDFIVFEDTQFQNNYKTYQQLSQFQGVIMLYLFQINISFCIVKPTEWKAACKIKGRKREEQKLNTIAFVKDKYGLDVSSDEADSIGIGEWAVNKIKGW
ncbi:crossover junction endodeoxyribonuclease RuvC [Desulfitobacterium metallireducens]|uniref:Uncharacterized protein n=1 Tax=Desulfitobacterium metallireducens DSM 15288 TaxID=871968 RepID=W0ECG9_9FIRM|nr:crossover junction endodeoxyribonuclease RuvC [Desulfitobacterium metallireducens]AHF08580.1 hypothetical protein DESME_08990 [Desulfitobacterium metallireducens DSM 15288]